MALVRFVCDRCRMTYITQLPMPVDIAFCRCGGRLRTSGPGPAAEQLTVNDAIRGEEIEALEAAYHLEAGFQNTEPGT
jgi:hypothetical protein